MSRKRKIETEEYDSKQKRQKFNIHNNEKIATVSTEYLVACLAHFVLPDKNFCRWNDDYASPPRVRFWTYWNNVHGPKFATVSQKLEIPASFQDVVCEMIVDTGGEGGFFPRKIKDVQKWLIFLANSGTKYLGASVKMSTSSYPLLNLFPDDTILLLDFENSVTSDHYHDHSFGRVLTAKEKYDQLKIQGNYKITAKTAIYILRRLFGVESIEFFKLEDARKIVSEIFYQSWPLVDMILSFL